MHHERVIVSWSGGKDSALALQSLLRSGRFEVAALLTTCSEDLGHVRVHGIPTSLIQCQSEALGIPSVIWPLPEPGSNHQYEAGLREALEPFRNAGIDSIVFGDLFLADIREFRDALLTRISFRTHYPIWGLDTAQLARQFIDDGFRAVLVSVDPHRLHPSFIGREFDLSLLADLPASVDPCGENGEFHTFVFDGPFFRQPVHWDHTVIHLSDRFRQADRAVHN
jgi:uncharacterized protein (TIGR00290 family)